MENLKNFISKHSDFANNSKIWIYQANRILTSQEKTTATHLLQQFVGEWNAHGNKIKGSFSILYDTFIILIADESTHAASGCSIDSSVKCIKTIGNKSNINFFDRFCIARFSNEKIEIYTKTKFQEIVKLNTLKSDDIVFNNTVTDFESLQTKWQTPFKGSWQENLFQQDFSPKFSL